MCCFAFSGESHDFWELIYIDKGELIITAGEHKYILKAGELAFHMPGEFHDIKANGTISPNVIVVSFSCKCRHMEFFRHKILFLDDCEKQLLSYIVKESADVFVPIESMPPVSGMIKNPVSPFGAEQIIRHDLEKLLICIYRRHDSIHIRQRSLRTNQQNSYKTITENIIGILEANLQSKLSLSDISERVNLSTSQVKKIFHKETGSSIMDYFISLKIEESKRLINESELNFTQISEYLGYETLAYFSRIFKNRNGMTPSEYSLSIKK